MKPLEFLFALLAKFIAFPEGRVAALKEEAANWMNKNRDKENALGKIITKSELWYVQILLAVLFLFSVKSVSNWLYSTSDTDTLHDDEEEDLPVNQHQKFKLQ